MKGNSKTTCITDGEDISTTMGFTGARSKMDSDTAGENGKPTMAKARMEIGSMDSSSDYIYNQA
jgi:hypothetical protein